MLAPQIFPFLPDATYFNVISDEFANSAFAGAVGEPQLSGSKFGKTGNSGLGWGNTS
jgi:hypothetical protein